MALPNAKKVLFSLIVLFLSYLSIGLVSAATPGQVSSQSVDGGTTPQSAAPNFSWSLVAGADSYTIQLCKVAFTPNNLCPTASVIPGATGIKTTSWIPTTSLPSNIIIFWRVQAVSSIYGSGPWSSISSFVSVNAPNTPVYVSPAAATVQTTLNPTLFWNTTTSTTNSVIPNGYDIQVATDLGFTNIVSSFSGAASDAGGGTVSVFKRYWQVSPALQAGTQYYWRVRSKNGTNASAWTKPTTVAALGAFKTQVGQPNLTFPISGAHAYSARPTFTWSAIAGAASYTVQRLSGTVWAAIGTSTTTSFTPTVDVITSPKGGVITWRILATGVTGFGTNYSVQNTFISASSPVIPVATALSTVQQQKPTFSWTLTTVSGVTNPGAFDLEIATDNLFTQNLIQRMIPLTNCTLVATKYTCQYTLDTNLANGTSYYWNVRSRVSGTVNSDASAWTLASLIKIQIATPTLVSPISVAAGSARPTFNWNAVPGAISYTIKWSQNGTTWVALPAVVAPAISYTPTTDVITTPTHGGTVYWTVTANSTLYGAATSNQASFISASAPPIPVLTALTSPQNTLNPKLIWTTTVSSLVTPPTTYEVQVASDIAFTNIVVNPIGTGSDNGSTSTKLVRYWNVTTGLQYGAQYYFRVRGINGTDASAWSTVGNFKTNVAAAAISAPTGVVTTTAPTFTWAPVTNAASYTVQTSVNGGGTYVALVGATAIKAPATSVTASVAALTLAAGQTQILWRVVTTGVTGYGTSNSNYSLSFTPITAPNIPTLNLPTTAHQEVTLTPLLKWTTSVPATSVTPASWEVQVSSDNAFNTIVSGAIGTGTTETSTTTSFVRSWVVTPALNTATTYYWRVRSKSGAGNTSAWSIVFSFKTPLSAPVTSTGTLTVDLSANPTSINTGQSSVLTATTGGTATGTTNYQFKCKATDGFTDNGSVSTINCSYTTAGTYQASVRATKAGVIADSTPVTITVSTQTSTSTSYEAELAVLSGAAGIYDCPTVCSGGKKVGSLGNADGTLQFTAINAPSAGTYTITMYYDNGDTNRTTTRLSINGGATSTISNLTPTGQVDSFSSINIPVTLAAGNNTLTFSNLQDIYSPDIDKIIVTNGTINLTLSVSATPAALLTGQTTTITATTGGNASGPITYQYKCRSTDSSFTDNGTNATVSSCYYTAAGTYQAVIQAVRMGVTTTASSNTITVTEPAPGPDNLPAGVGPRNVRVLEIRYIPQDTTNERSATDILSYDLLKAMEEGSKPKGYQDASAHAYLNYSKLRTIERDTVEPAGTPPNQWYGSLTSTLTQDNLCDYIVANNIDQVWIWKDVVYEQTHQPNGFNLEQTRVYSKVASPNQDPSTLVCSGRRTFLVLGLEIKLGIDYSNSIHSFGHSMEDVLSGVLQGYDFYWNNFSGEGLNPTYKASICGDVHFPPNGLADYDYGNTTNVSTSCPNWKPDGTGTKVTLNCTKWGCDQGGYLKWWLQNMPNYNSTAVWQGKKLPNWQDFLSDFDTTFRYYAARHNTWYLDENWLANNNPDFMRPLYVDSISHKTDNSNAIVTWSHTYTTTSNNPLFTVLISYRTTDQTNGKVASVSFAGQPLTLLQRQTNGMTSELWYLPPTQNSTIPNPTSPNTVSVTFTGPVDSKIMSAYTFTGVNQTSTPFLTAPVVAGQDPTTTNVPATHNLTVPSQSGYPVIGFHTMYAGGNPVTSTNTESNYNNNYINTLQTVDLKTAAGTSTNFSWSTQHDFAWDTIGVGLKP